LWLRGNNTSLFGILCNWSKELAFLRYDLPADEGNAMRIFMVCAITMAAAIFLGGCFWHHQAAVVTQAAPPLK
jgi:hypothetical protein